LPPSIPAHQVVKERLGHGSITTTERYLHTLHAPPLPGESLTTYAIKPAAKAEALMSFSSSMYSNDGYIGRPSHYDESTSFSKVACCWPP
jgi:hypothetical protein